MITRDEILAALGRVPGLSPSPVQPGALLAYASWPVWDHTEYANRCVAKETWQVYVVLPNPDHLTAALAGDALRFEVSTALFSIPAWVDRAEPALLQVEDGGQAVPALQFTVTE